jgi:hypothetical protein
MSELVFGKEVELLLRTIDRYGHESDHAYDPSPGYSRIAKAVNNFESGADPKMNACVAARNLEFSPQPTGSFASRSFWGCEPTKRRKTLFANNWV